MCPHGAIPVLKKVFMCNCTHKCMTTKNQSEKKHLLHDFMIVRI